MSAIDRLKVGCLPAMAAVIVSTLDVHFVHAQGYPARPVHIITAESGSGGDIVGRLVVPGLSAGLGQAVVVENRGGPPVNSAGAVAKAAPDGHTLLLHGATVWLLPFMQDAGYDVLRDLAPVTQLVSAPNVLVVNPALAVSDVKSLIALAKARPGELNYTSGPSGSTSHLTTELFKSMAAVNLVRVPFKGTAPALNDVIGGHLELMFSVAVSVTPHVKSGRLRALAIASAQPSAVAPGLPTIASFGLPGFESVITLGILAPARTLAAVLSRINREVALAANVAEVKDKIFATGAEVVAGTPEQFAATMKSEMVRMGKVIKDAGIRPD